MQGLSQGDGPLLQVRSEDFWRFLMIFNDFWFPWMVKCILQVIKVAQKLSCNILEHNVRLVIRASKDTKNLLSDVCWSEPLKSRMDLALGTLGVDAGFNLDADHSDQKSAYLCISQGCCSFLWFGNERLVSIFMNRWMDKDGQGTSAWL